MRLNSPLVLGLAAAFAARSYFRRRNEISFAGRAVLITGGSRGLGLVLARQLAAEGARLMLVARDPDELERALDELRGQGAEAEAFAGDVADPCIATNAVTTTIEAFGRLDVLINNAGIITMGPLETMTEQDYEHTFATHVWGPLRFMNAALPHLKRARGRIVNISSFAGQIAVPHMAPYCASKFALAGLSDAFGAELASAGVKVTTVCPGLMRTGSHVQAQFKGKQAQEFAWFVSGLSTSLTSMDAERAAGQIIDACRRGQPQITVGIQARLAVIAHALFPNLSARIAQLGNRLLPASPASGGRALPGSKARGAFPPRAVTAMADMASHEINEM